MTRVTEDIKGISCLKINLIIDFLKFIKQKSSLIIHIEDKDIKIQKEILYEYLDKPIYNSDKENKIPIQDAKKIIFEKNKKKVINSSKKQSKSYDKIIKMIEDENQKNESAKGMGVKNDNFIQDDEKRIKNIILGEETWININLSSHLDQLIKILKKNQECLEEVKLGEIETIDGEFFYNSWKKSFEELQFKNHSKFKKFIKKEEIMTLANMGFYLGTLLDNFFIDIYVSDPNKLEKKVRNEK